MTVLPDLHLSASTSRVGRDDPPEHPLLELERLRTYFVQQDRTVRAVNGVSYRVQAGETLAVVGESGCGKSIHARSILRLLPRGGRIVSGAIRFNGVDLTKLDEREMRRVRGPQIGMIFQEPMNSLNPLLTIGRQLTEPLQAHLGMSRRDARLRAIDLLAKVRLPDPERHLREYPHQLSGGMCQRVMLAIAISCDPVLLIADEPTTALDVTVQAQILDLISGLCSETGMALILITHDLGVVARYADHVAVMYAGSIVEYAPTADLYSRPAHPYTRDLLRSLPKVGQRSQRLNSIAGSPPDLTIPWDGCAYAPRCSSATAECSTDVPPWFQVGPSHVSRCWRYMDAVGTPVAAPAGGKVDERAGTEVRR
ncbi:MAG: ABC transporter ATP-binding protein [Acidimicrobiia bacterium]